MVFGLLSEFVGILPYIFIEGKNKFELYILKDFP